MKKVSKSLSNIMENYLVMDILDRSIGMTDVIDDVTAFWSYDLYSRKPGPACRNDVFIGTDLDMAAFLFALVDRGASVMLPTYKSFRKKQLQEGQIITSTENRHGQILGIVSNMDTFNMSLKIKDMNVMMSDGVGDYRNFTMTDFYGDWYNGWETIKFLQNADENKFINESKIAVDNTITFKNFVHPNRWISLYGSYYFITKLLINRLTEECAYLNKVKKVMITAGIKYPVSKDGSQYIPNPPKTFSHKGDVKRVKVDAFQVQLEVPKNVTEYSVYDLTSENLLEVTKLRKFFMKKKSNLQFMVRATEMAFALNDGHTKFPGWIKDAKWEIGYKQKGGKKIWNRLVVTQPLPGPDKKIQQGVSILTRWYEKSEEVDSEYNPPKRFSERGKQKKGIRRI